MAPPESRLSRIAKAPLRALALLGRGESRLVELGDEVRQLARGSNDLLRAVRKLTEHAERSELRLNALTRELHEVRREFADRLLQNSLQLGRLAGAGGGRAQDDEAPRAGGRTLPLEIDGSQVPGWEVPGGDPHPDPAGEQWLHLEACPFCGHPEGTRVLEWNKLLMLSKAPDPGSVRYDFTICHACGVGYAARRPFGARLAFLLEHFGEVTAKGGGEIPNPLLNPTPLSTADEERLRRMAAHGVFVSDHLGLKKDEYLEGLLKDRFENSVHVDLLGNLIDLAGARVLEVRPRAGTIADSLRRLYRAQVSVMPIWESQRFLLREVYGFDSGGLIDFDHFTIPHEGPFDLIVCNHLLTHAVRPAECLAELRRHLKPGGYLYLYNEPHDREFLEGQQSIIAHLNPLHMQTFDQRSMVRALAANGFEVTFIKERNFNHLCLARAHTDPVAWAPMDDATRRGRVKRYLRARDRAIVRLPAEVRPRIAAEWSGAVERGVAAGDLDFDAKGQLRFVAR